MQAAIVVEVEEVCSLIGIAIGLPCCCRIGDAVDHAHVVAEVEGIDRVSSAVDLGRLIAEIVKPELAALHQHKGAVRIAPAVTATKHSHVALLDGVHRQRNEHARSLRVDGNTCIDVCQLVIRLDILDKRLGRITKHNTSCASAEQKQSGKLHFT